MKYTKLALLFSAALLMTSCASPNPVVNIVQGGEISQSVIDAGIANPAGFWRGLWHGLTAFFSFWGMVFGFDVGIYETFNTGGWYNFGFALGIGAVFGCASSSSER